MSNISLSQAWAIVLAHQYSRMDCDPTVPTLNEYVAPTSEETWNFFIYADDPTSEVNVYGSSVSTFLGGDIQAMSAMELMTEIEIAIAEMAEEYRLASLDL